MICPERHGYMYIIARYAQQLAIHTGTGWYNVATSYYAHSLRIDLLPDQCHSGL